MTEKFDMQAAREMCEKLFDKSYSGREFVDVAYQSALAAEMLPAALDRIEELCDDNARLAKMFAEDVYIESARLEPEHYDLRVRGKGAMLLAGQIIKMFRDSGGKNFLTNTMAYEFGDPITRELYELTVQKVNGEDSPAMKIERQAKRIAELVKALVDKQAENIFRYGIEDSCVVPEGIPEDFDFAGCSECELAICPYRSWWIKQAREQLEKEGLL